MEIITYIAISVLIVLVISSFMPIVPSGLLSSSTVIIFWWYTGYTEINILIVISLVFLGLLVEITDFASGIIAGKLSGSSNIAVIFGTIFGFILIFVIGPIGFVIGISSIVFIHSLYVEEDEVNIASKKSLYTVIGVLASNIIQFMMLSILVVTFTVFTLII